MSSPTLPIKRHNHRIHPCKSERKSELLNALLTQYAGENILVITANDPETIQNLVSTENVIVKSDTDLADTPDLKCDVVISFDLPPKAMTYMIRLSRAKTHALVLLDPDEQKLRYPIEQLLGRTILEEIISGFEPESDTATEEKPRDFKRQEHRGERKPRQEGNRSDRKYDDKPRRDDKRPPRKPYTSDSKDKPKSDRWDKKDKSSSKYIGKDENGKPIFSGKTRERNHRYDGTPKENTDNASNKRYEGKPKFSEGDKKPGDRKERSYDSKQKSDTQGKKPWDKSKSYDDKKQSKPYDKTFKSKSYSSKSSDNKPAPKRTPRTFKKSLEQQKESD